MRCPQSQCCLGQKVPTYALWVLALGGIPRISSNRDDQMGSKIKTKNYPYRLLAKPHWNIPKSKFNSPKNAMPNWRARKICQKKLNCNTTREIEFFKKVWLYFNHRTWQPGYTSTTKNLQIVLNTPQNPYLNQAIRKNTRISDQKISESKISNPKSPSIIPVTWNLEYLPEVLACPNSPFPLNASNEGDQ